MNESERIDQSINNHDHKLSPTAHVGKKSLYDHTKELNELSRASLARINAKYPSTMKPIMRVVDSQLRVHDI